MTPLKTKTSVGLETPDETVARAKAQLALLEPKVSAKDLTTGPTTPPPITPVQQPGIPPRVDTTVNNVLGSIRSTSDTAKRLQEEQAAFATFADESSGFDIQNEQLKRFGVTPEKLKELEDIQLQLADRKTASELTKTQIEGAAGQTIGQAQREVTQEDREAAVRDAGLAARAAVLQGNIETGRALANDAVQIALADRTFKANAKLQEIADLKDIVDEETRQLLLAEERTYQEELARINEVKTNVSNAIASGAASQQDIATLTDPNVDDATKLALAQSIISRGASEMRNLEIAQMNASIANTYDQIAARAEQNKALLGTLNGKAQTETERLTEGYANRMMEGDGLISQLGSQFTGAASIFGQLAPNMLKSADRQKYEQAERNFINAVLRRESGATITDEEFSNARLQYIPQPGDSEGVVQQKAQNRQTAIKSMYQTANVPMPELEEQTLQPGFSGTTASGLSYTILQ